MNTRPKVIAMIVIASLCSVASYGQVTIGSETPPIEGALLQLKENENVEGNSTKGLGLPRVKLTNLSPETDIELAQSIGNPTESYNLSDHSGMAIYNVNEDICASEPIYKGMYVWEGTKWQYTGQLPNYYNDTRNQLLGSQSYPYRTFGAAGTWMLENMRYIPPVGAPVEITASADSTTNVNDKFYIYPNGDRDNPANAPATWSASQGLLYTYSAATLGIQDGVNVNQGANGGVNEGPPTYIEGICPKGWHIPSDKEWNELEKELYNNAGEYSSYTPTELAGWNPITWDSTWNTSTGYRGSTGTGGHGLAMQSPCKVSVGTQEASEGKSLPMAQGGFDAALAGHALYGTVHHYSEGAYFWSSSTYNASNVWMRYVQRPNLQMFRYGYNRYFLFSVRCKKDN